MNLTIIITGLVLLVPDRDAGRLHLFFPQVDMSRPGMELHRAHLDYVSAAEGRLSVPLDGWALDLGTLARPGAATALPSEVINLHGLFAGGVPRSWLTGTPPNQVMARLSLPMPRSIKAESTAHWRLKRGWGSKPVTLTNSIVLEYEVGNPLPATWTLVSLRSGPNETKPISAYRPGGAGDTIRIINAPPGGGAKMELGQEGLHFQGYVDLLRLRRIDRWRPRPHIFLDKPLTGLSPYNCMLASSEFRP